MNMLTPEEALEKHLFKVRLEANQLLERINWDLVCYFTGSNSINVSTQGIPNDVVKLVIKDLEFYGWKATQKYMVDLLEIVKDPAVVLTK